MKILSYDALVVGTGCAGFNAAIRLHAFGKNVAILTEGVDCGTSRNTGSDKQTYYKLGLGGDAPDSVYEMAKNLFAGGSVDGDNALCEAALSARSFFHLCEAGVPFPVNRYGEYVGYKTDHDPYARATSAGPLTSKFMTEALEKEAKELAIPVHSGFLAIKILKQNDQAVGLICLEKKTGDYVAFCCGDLVLCTGGPAGIYADSVYPLCHTGSTGLALAAGARAQNLTEWQYGLASVSPRWNVSGTYMQVLPRLVSVDKEGVEREFLTEYFSDPAEALTQLFLKGYQWPFDSRKVLEGSSVIDLLVYRENILRQRKVYLDFRKNPFGFEKIPYDSLSPEAREYLEKAGACFGTPLDRLKKMNEPAIELYRSKGVDLAEEMLEIALCAQHHNGGIAVDLWWQSSVKGLFAAGECAGTHGITRPGGSALNAGQVGSLRAAQYIARHGRSLMDEGAFAALAEEACEEVKRASEYVSEDLSACIDRARRRMSDHAAAIRNSENIRKALSDTENDLEDLKHGEKRSTPGDRVLYWKLWDLLVCQKAVLSAMIYYEETVGRTRGSSLCTNPEGKLRAGLEESFRFLPEEGETREKVQEVWLEDGDFRAKWRPVRPLPRSEDFFETVWARFREDGNVY